MAMPTVKNVNIQTLIESGIPCKSCGRPFQRGDGGVVAMPDYTTPSAEIMHFHHYPKCPPIPVALSLIAPGRSYNVEEGWE